MIQVLVVEDSRITRDAIESQIAKSERYVLYASIENAANAEIACLRGSVDLILMDVCTADEESGLKAAAKIKQYNPKIKIVIMTSMPEHSFIQKAKACGCNGFWYKEYGSTALKEVCDRVMNGEFVYPEDTPMIRIGYSNSAEFTNLILSGSLRKAENTKRLRRIWILRQTPSSTTSRISCRKPATRILCSW